MEQRTALDVEGRRRRRWVGLFVLQLGLILMLLGLLELATQGPIF